jgi:hypothetical protein
VSIKSIDGPRSGGRAPFIPVRDAALFIGTGCSVDGRSSIDESAKSERTVSENVASYLWQIEPGVRMVVAKYKLNARRLPLSRGGSVVVLQQASEPFTRQNATVADGRGRYRYDQLIAQALMVPFVMIVLDEFADGTPKRLFTDENHPVQARFLDHPDEALRVRVGVSRQLHR